jgi:hypothetical protein
MAAEAFLKNPLTGAESYSGNSLRETPNKPLKNLVARQN